ncbi:MAG: FtsW/RodA/SpoVE family cell cycle protein, partial [Candidatus Promineifilaceae bacterium]
MRRYRPIHDPFLLPITGLLSGWGLVILDRLLPSFLHRQVIWIALAGAAFLLSALLPASLWFFRKYRYLWLMAGLLLLAATLIFGVNPSGYGAALWLRIPFAGGVYFQPSELLKLIMLIFLASYFDEQELLSRHGLSSFRFGSLRSMAPLLLMWFFSLTLLIWQRDLGAAALFFVVFLALLFLASGDWKIVFGGLAMLALASIAAYLFYDVVATRIDMWLNPWPAAREEGYQIVQSLYAIVSGNVIGQGIGQGFPTYVPVVHTDFTFAAVAEEWGLIGGLAVILSFAFISYRGFKIALSSTTFFRMYLSAGISLMVGVQALLILGGITRLLPLTGVTLPFVSYGGSSLVMSFVMVGLLVNLSSPHLPLFSAADAGVNSGAVATGIRQATKDRLRQLSIVTVLSFALVFLLVAYWTALRGAQLLARDDNPRLVEAEQRISRGTIYDANGEILAESVEDADEHQNRIYNPFSGPLVGYYSFEHGQVGIENAMDAALRGETGDPWADFVDRELLHEVRVGRDVRTTIDASWQQTAAEALDGRQGAVILLSLADNAVRAMISQPTYNPNLLDEQFETLTQDESGPLINRAVQGQYQPGLILQPFLLAEAINKGVIDFGGDAIDKARSISIGGTTLLCEAADSDPENWGEVLEKRCPSPMMALAALLGEDGVYQVYESFGLTDVPDLNIGERSDQDYTIQDLEMALVGQDTLSISPMQAALALSILANQGEYRTPVIIGGIQDENGSWRPVADEVASRQVLSPESAEETLRWMATEEGRIEHTVSVLSGPEGSTNSWYLGLAPSNAPGYALVVVLEGEEDTGAVEAIGRQIFSEVLGGG